MNAEQLKFVFDDEPLENILYGKTRRGPSLANLYLPGQIFGRKILTAYEQDNIGELLETASWFSPDQHPLSLRMAVDLAKVFRALVPDVPNPILEHDLKFIGPVIEDIWELATEKDEKPLQAMVSTPLYRWYEHYGFFEKAIAVLRGQITDAQLICDQNSEAILTNNLGFEYLLDKRWAKAIPFFEKAATLFQKNNFIFEYLNARTNYLTCWIECPDFKDTESIRKELNSLIQELGKHNDWRVRKPLVALAKLEERQGHYDTAVKLVENAITAGQSSRTKYPELDATYLENLKRKQADKENQ